MQASVLLSLAVICHAFLLTDKDLQLWTETEQDYSRHLTIPVQLAENIFFAQLS